MRSRLFIAQAVSFSGGVVRKTGMFLLAISMLLLSTGSAAASVISPDMQRRTLDLVWKSLVTIHPSGERLPDRLSGLYRSLQEKIDRPLEPLSFYWLLAPLVSQVGDVHTALAFTLDEPLMSAKVFLPLDLVFVGERLFVSRSYAADGPGLIGTELLAINDVPLAILLQQLTAALPGETVTSKRRSLETDMFKILLRAGWPQWDVFSVHCRLADGTIVDQRLAGISPNEIRQQCGPKQRKKNNLEILVAQKLAVLRIIGFEEKDGLAAFLRRSFTEIRQAKINHLLIDLRDNPGGTSDLSGNLLSYICKRPLPTLARVQIRVSAILKKQFKQRIPGLLRWLPLQFLDKRGREVWRARDGALLDFKEVDTVEPGNPDLHFSGSTALLINGHVFSCAHLFAGIFQRENLGRIYGQESGGLQGMSYGEKIRVELPCPNLVLEVAGMALFEKDPPQVADHGVRPDIWIDQYPLQETAGTDSLLEKAKELFLKEPTASATGK
jgi:hypothetical protein